MQVIHICCRDKFDQTTAIQSSNGHVCRAWLQRSLQFQVVTDSFTLQLPGPNASRTSMKSKDGQSPWFLWPIEFQHIQNGEIKQLHAITCNYKHIAGHVIANMQLNGRSQNVSKMFVWQSHEILHCHFSSTMSCKQASTVVWQACCCADALQRFGSQFPSMDMLFSSIFIHSF